MDGPGRPESSVPVDEIAGRRPSLSVMTAATRWCRVTLVGPGRTEIGRLVLEGPGLPDLGAVETVARLSLMAGRRGGAIVLADVSPHLRQLLEVAGLEVEVEGEAEGGKESFGVEGMQEETHLGDLPA